MVLNKRKKSVEICLATIKDAVGIFLVQKATWLATYPNREFGVTRNYIKAHFADKKKRVASWKKEIKESKDRSIWVAKNGNRVVGFCRAVKLKDRHAIGAIYILPEYQRRGIGQALITQALDWLGRRQKIFVGVAPYNKKAIHFYKKFGFKVVGIIKTGKLPEIEMVRKDKKYNKLTTTEGRCC